MNKEEFIEKLIEGKPDKKVVPDEVAVSENFVYAHVNHRPLRMDIFRNKISPSSKRPAVVFVHGGGWRGGTPAQFWRYGSYLALQQNYLCVSVEYRLSGEALYPAAVHDLKAAVRWLRANADKENLDPEQIAVVGGSAGGHLAAFMAATNGVKELEGSTENLDCSSDVNACVSLNGALDVWDQFRCGKGDGLREFGGKSPEDSPETYNSLCPLMNANSKMPPTLLIHGDKDETVSCEQSITFHNRLQELGVHSELDVRKGYGHGWFNEGPDLLPVVERIEKFLAKFFN